MALVAGVPAERLVLHGNNKSTEELAAALSVGVGRIVVDSFDEIARLAGPAAAALAPLLDGWRRRLAALATAGVPERALTLTTAFVRPFGYYDGMLFEVRSDALGPDQPVAAGGRYDALPSRFGGTPGAVGCMVRPGRAFDGRAVEGRAA